MVTYMNTPRSYVHFHLVTGTLRTDLSDRKLSRIRYTFATLEAALAAAATEDLFVMHDGEGIIGVRAMDAETGECWVMPL